MITRLPTALIRHRSARLGLTAGMLLLAGSAEALTFISPMGEPFRTRPDEKPPEEVWFEQADANHDGKITRAEFTADAGRFFRILDTNHDNVISADEIQHYEDDIAPETQGGFADLPAGGGGHGGGGRGGGHGGGHGGGGSRRNHVSSDTRNATDEDNVTNTYLKTADSYDAGNIGAARFSYLDLPEPVAAADTNFDRAISPREFVDAAHLRFDALDTNHDGVLTHDELPHLGGGHFGHGQGGKGGDRRPHPGGGDH